MDFRSRRLRTGLLLGTAFLGGIAIGPASGLIGRHFGYDFGLSAFAAQDANRTDTYRLLTLFGDVFERVRAYRLGFAQRSLRHQIVRVSGLNSFDQFALLRVTRNDGIATALTLLRRPFGKVEPQACLAHFRVGTMTTETTAR